MSALAFACACACNATGLSTGDAAATDLALDAATDFASDFASDAAPDLAGWIPTDAGVSCGTMTCAPNQVCVYPCPNPLPDLAGCSAQPNGCGTRFYCVDVPATCSPSVTCGCFAADPCDVGPYGGACGGVTNGYVDCTECPI